jgi:hypothetical protein
MKRSWGWQKQAKPYNAPNKTKQFVPEGKLAVELI